MKKVFQFSFIVVLVVLLGLASFSCKPAQEGEKFDRSGIDISRPDEEVNAGDITWNLLEAEYLGPLIIHEDAGGTLETSVGRFLAIRFTAVNNGSESRFIYDLKAIDSNGNKYSVCIEAYGYIGAEEACVLEELLPGIERTFAATYDVPLNAVDLILEVTDLRFPAENSAYIDLGL